MMNVSRSMTYEIGLIIVEEDICFTGVWEITAALHIATCIFVKRSWPITPVKLILTELITAKSNVNELRFKNNFLPVTTFFTFS